MTSQNRNSDLTAVDVGEKIGQKYTKHGNYVITHCYNTTAHSQGDRKPSLTIYDFDKGYFCFACGESGTHSWLLKQFGIEDRNYGGNWQKTQRVLSGGAKKAPAPAPKKDYTSYPLGDIYATLAPLPPDATEILEAKGFNWQTWENVAGWKWHTNQIAGWDAGIFIPYYVDGEMVAARLRRLDGNPRFKGLTGGESFGYCMDNLSAERVYVCEGETDTQTLNFLGFKAVGVPGSTNAEAIRKIVARAAQTGARLVVIPDNDEAGQKFLNRMRAEAFDQRVPITDFTIPGYKDVNEWFVSAGQEIFENTLLKHANEDLFAPLPKKYKQAELELNNGGA